MPTKVKTRSIPAQLDDLKQRRTEAGVLERDARAQAQELEAKVTQLRNAIQSGYGTKKNVANLEEELFATEQVALQRARLREEGWRQQGTELDLVRRHLVTTNFDVLVAELLPQEQAALDRMKAGVAELVAGADDWKDTQVARQALLRDAPDRLMQDRGEAQHGYERILEEVRRSRNGR